jgi:hypothetical protein
MIISRKHIILFNSNNNKILSVLTLFFIFNSSLFSQNTTDTSGYLLSKYKNQLSFGVQAQNFISDNSPHLHGNFSYYYYINQKYNFRGGFVVGYFYPFQSLKRNIVICNLGFQRNLKITNNSLFSLGIDFVYYHRNQNRLNFDFYGVGPIFEYTHFFSKRFSISSELAFSYGKQYQVLESLSGRETNEYPAFKFNRALLIELNYHF